MDRTIRSASFFFFFFFFKWTNNQNILLVPDWKLQSPSWLSNMDSFPSLSTSASTRQSTSNQLDYRIYYRPMCVRDLINVSLSLSLSWDEVLGNSAICDFCPHNRRERERDPTSLPVYNKINHQDCITEYERAEQSGVVDTDMIVV